ncbi:hypothetical protein NDU88_000864 [Pleurodeles waltl]|uniref:Uncharacterized protein n=1 Tax=Pleurodeles waltl TaxID=8319 RepID=A0AAV7KNW9_PLEWA|nr:hypothetical protein NDU88_000864 [Pleurodeles waltl]
MLSSLEVKSNRLGALPSKGKQRLAYSENRGLGSQLKMARTFVVVDVQKKRCVRLVRRIKGRSRLSPQAGQGALQLWSKQRALDLLLCSWSVQGSAHVIVIVPPPPFPSRRDAEELPAVIPRARMWHGLRGAPGVQAGTCFGAVIPVTQVARRREAGSQSRCLESFPGPWRASGSFLGHMMEETELLVEIYCAALRRAAGVPGNER